MKTLILTEKPSVARDFARSLNVSTDTKFFFENDRYVICWAFGHLLRPYNPEDYSIHLKKWRLADLPILPERLLYLPDAHGKKQLGEIKKLLKRSDINHLIVATDAGREGELIARTIMGDAKCKLPADRFWTSEALTSAVILHHLSGLKPLSSYDSIYIAGKARQFADWLVGMNLSRLATLKLGALYSIGRVQTAVLGLLVDRRHEIDQFIPKQYWQLQLDAIINGERVKFLWFNPKLEGEQANQFQTLEQLTHLLKKIDSSSGYLESIEKKKQEHAPPLLYSLTELQRDANKLYGLSASNTLEIAQKLYEKHKCLSYPRTDAQHLGESSISLVKSLLNMVKNNREDYYRSIDHKKVSIDNKLVFDQSKLTDHHALLPLSFYKGHDLDERKIYDLVLRRFVQVFCHDAESIDYTLVAKVGDEYFKHKERLWTRLGWRELEVSVGEDQESATLKFEQFECKQIVNIKELKPLEKATTPASEYTESSLLRDMANPARLVSDKEHKSIFRTHVGLGTQATRAQIIETLIAREYIIRKKRSLIALPKGVQLIKELRNNPVLTQITSASSTAEWEIQLEGIAHKKVDGLTFINQVKDYIASAVNSWR